MGLIVENWPYWVVVAAVACGRTVVGENNNRAPRMVPFQEERQLVGDQAVQLAVQGKQSMATLSISKRTEKASRFEERIHHQGVRHEMALVEVEECGMSLVGEEAENTSVVEPVIGALEKVHNSAIRNCSE